MKAELELIQIENDICHIKLTLIIKNLSDGDDENIRIKFDLSSTRISDFRVNSSHLINDLHALTSWFDTADRKDVTNKEKVRKFFKEKLDAHKTLNSKKSIGLG